ncbi:uncharacterized protein LOC100260165 [Vitis vinifera]|uniref:uncharacterized protein LOC100260165 n=1 Tax=Vitis vinifera TaxID=29760 RepID=UPI002882DE45|nr:uncharacterized protein LOC100260165 [Vitis vinifera]
MRCPSGAHAVHVWLARGACLAYSWCASGSPVCVGDARLVRPWCVRGARLTRPQCARGTRLTRPWCTRGGRLACPRPPHMAPGLWIIVDMNDFKSERTCEQVWEKESRTGYQNSNLADQCTHRYKIYVEGWGWSVSEKYVLACDSMTLLTKPYHHDFFTRSMVPLQHYWPIRPRNKCRDLKFAVEWGNTHPEKAQEIGKAGSNFIHEDLKMDFVYDYMFHLLNEYSKLLKFKPAVPPGAVELCLETMDCSADAVLQKFVMESTVNSPTDSAPCSMPPHYSPESFRAFLNKKENLTRQVEMWGHAYWENQNKQL